MRHFQLLAAVLAVACAKAGAPAIGAGSKVSMQYTLKVDGQVVDSSKGGQPLTYTHGQGQIVPGLEAKLTGRKAGDSFAVIVAPKEGYGEHDPAGLRKVPWAQFGGQRKGLKAGDMVSGQANGRPFQAKIAAVADDGVTLDLNHPLAGKTLEFSIEVVDVKPAGAAG